MKVVLFAVAMEAPLCTFHDALAPREVADAIVVPSALAAWHMAPQAPMVPWNTVGVVAPGLIFSSATEFRPPATADPYVS